MAKGTFGALLKRERELREVSLNELTVKTRVPPKFLEALENEQWEKLPGGVFNRGFIRAIARYLGLSEEHLLSEYDLAHREHEVIPPPAPPNPIPSPPKWLIALGALLAVVALAAAVAGGVYGWRRYAAHRAAKRALAASTQPPSTPALPNLMPEAAAAAPSNPLDLAVSTSAGTHVRIVADGKVLADDAFPAGTARHFSAAQQFEVTAADPSAVLLELNRQPIVFLPSAASSGTIVLSQKDLRQARSGNSQP
jgi:transcriptional regulator with XRE-family HTH domain